MAYQDGFKAGREQADKNWLFVGLLIGLWTATIAWLVVFLSLIGK